MPTVVRIASEAATISSALMPRSTTLRARNAGPTRRSAVISPPTARTSTTVAIMSAPVAFSER